MLSEQEIKVLSAGQILREMANLFMAPGHDRQVYAIFGRYSELKPLQSRIEGEVKKGNYHNGQGSVHFLSLNRAIPEYLQKTGHFAHAQELAKAGRESELQKILSRSFSELVTGLIEKRETLGLFLADFELMYSYDLGGNDISLVRQVAVNGKKICLLIPGGIHDQELKIFDEDAESRRTFPSTLLFSQSGWVFQVKGD